MHTRLHRDLDRWSEHGLITAAQADAIAAFEAAENTSKTSFLAEGLGYVGAALALGAGLLFARRVWTGLPVAGRLSLLGVFAVLFFASGWLLRTRGDPPLRRLTDVLWSAAAVAAGTFAAEFAAEIIGWSDEWAAIAAGVTTMLAAATLWTIRRHALEMITAVGGAVFAIISAVSLFAPDASPVVAGSAIWILGGILLAAGHAGVLQPKRTALVLGAVIILFGSQIIAFEGTAVPLVAAVVSAGLLVLYAIRERDNVLLSIGSVGVLVLVPQLVFALFGETLGAPVALFVTGIALVGIAVFLVRGHTENGPPADDHQAG